MEGSAEESRAAAVFVRTICPHTVSRDTDLFNSFLVRCVGVTALEGITCQGIYVTDELSVVWVFKSSLGRMSVHTRK